MSTIRISPIILIADVLDIRAFATSKAVWDDHRVTRQHGDVFYEKLTTLATLNTGYPLSSIKN